MDSVIEATNMNLTQLQEAVEDRRTWHALVHGVTKSRTRLNNNNNNNKKHSASNGQAAFHLGYLAGGL